MTIKHGTGSIETKEEHGSIQLHIEWKSPIENEGEGQTRGNSGIIFQARYEVQVLNSYQNKTYPCIHFLYHMGASCYLSI